MPLWPGGESPTFGGTKAITGTLTVGGQIRAADGTAALPGYAFTNYPDKGLYATATALAFTVGGAIRGYFDANSFNLSAGMYWSWADDVRVYRDAANVMALRNGTAAQILRVANTWTDATANEYGRFGWVSNVLRIGAENLGAGVLRNVRLIGANVVYGVDAVGTSGVGVLGIGNGTEPSTSPADMIQLFSVDIAAGRATLGLRTEEVVAADIGLASTNSYIVKINGATYKILLTLVP